jgi:hypothetical protein
MDVLGSSLFFLKVSRPMKFAKNFAQFISVSALVSLAACGGGSSSGAPSCTQFQSNNNPVAPSGNNIVPISVSTDQSGTVNQPFVSVTICAASNPTDCQTINNILLDTGSYGLRIFNSLVTIPTTPIPVSSGHTLAECVAYGTGSQWGEIAPVYVTLNGQTTATTVNMQLVDASLPAGIPANSDCASKTDTDPNSAGYNGILGVGLFDNDCGTGCTDAALTYYFSCSAGNCVATTANASTQQVQNPVAHMASGFNNGISITLPSVPSCGSSGATGYMALGVASQSNNTPSGPLTVLPADSNAEMFTIWQGQQEYAFIDSGSNSLSFSPTSDTSICDDSTSAPGFLCPDDSPTYTATMQGASGNNQVAVQFQVVNANSLVTGGNTAFSTLSSAGDSSSFDWGISFFFGRTVYIGIKNQAASGVGTGPYWAF